MATTKLVALDTDRYFDKVLRFGVANGIIPAARFDQILAEGAKGIVQIANYFGSAHLRTDLEVAKERMITLVSLCLEARSEGDLLAAATSLNERSLLSHSKGGSDMLRTLSAMPTQSEDLGLPVAQSGDAMRDDLDNWTFSSALDLQAYRAEVRTRQAIQDEVDFARWLLAYFKEKGGSAAFNSEIVTSAMLVLFVKDAPLRMPTYLDCVGLIAALRRKRSGPDEARLAGFMADVPASCSSQARSAIDAFAEHALPRIRCADQTADNLLYGVDPLNLYIREDTDEDSRRYEPVELREWHRMTSRRGDDPKVRATLLLRVATGLDPQSTLLKREAREIVRVFRTSGFDSRAVIQFIDGDAPARIRDELKEFWNEELAPEAQDALSVPDPDYPVAFMSRAVTYLRKTCNATWKRDDG